MKLTMRILLSSPPFPTHPKPPMKTCCWAVTYSSELCHIPRKPIPPVYFAIHLLIPFPCWLHCSTFILASESDPTPTSTSCWLLLYVSQFRCTPRWAERTCVKIRNSAHNIHPSTSISIYSKPTAEARREYRSR